MRETISQLRELIVAQIRKEQIDFRFADFTPNEPEIGGSFVRHPTKTNRADNPGDDGKTWDCTLFERNHIGVILSFNVARLNSQLPLHDITLCGHVFRTVRLFIYDNKPAPRGMVLTAPQQLVNRLRNHFFNEERAAYYVEPDAGRAEFANVVGHIIDLYIRGTNTGWNIGAGLTSDQLLTASTGLVANVKAALRDLLPAAQYYVNNRNRVLSGQA